MPSEDPADGGLTETPAANLSTDDLSADAANGHRLHPISLFFGVGTTIWALLIFLIASRAFNSCIVVLFLPAIASSVVKYLSFRYWLGPEEMVIREGILRRNERHIPYARIQNIDLIQNPLHRLFKVAVVRLETASGGRPEAVISVLTLPVIEEMRSKVFSQRSKNPGDVEREAANDSGTPLLKLPVSELAIFGAISNKGMVMVAAALGLASQTGTFDRFLDPDQATVVIEGSAAVQRLPIPTSGPVLLLWILGGLMALWMALRGLSAAWAIVKYYAFRLEQHGDDLRAEYGLLTRVTATIPRHRIQLVTVHLTPLHRFFDRASVQVDTAGGGTAADQNQQGGVQEQQWLAPIMPRLKVLTLLRSVMPESRLEHLDWQPISPRAWRRLFVRWLMFLLVVTLASFAVLEAGALLLAALGVPLAFVHAQLYAQRTGYALTPAAVLYRSGCWVRQVSIVPFGKIQVLGLHQSPFDRRNAMASVRVDTAGATLGSHRVAIRYLDAEAAREVLLRLDEETSRTTFKW